MDTFELTSAFFFYFSYYYARDVTYGFRGAVPSIMLSSPALRASCYSLGSGHTRVRMSFISRASRELLLRARRSFRSRTPFISRASRELLLSICQRKEVFKIFHFSRFARVVTVYIGNIMFTHFLSRDSRTYQR